MLRGLTISVNITTTGQIDSNKIRKFHKLAQITESSIDGEKLSCDSEVIYSQVSAPWIPVKCYYLLYYLESEFIHLINGSLLGFKPGGHTKVRESIKDLINRGDIRLVGSYSTQLSNATTWLTANSFRTIPHSNVRDNYFLEPNCIESIRKKLSRYIEIDWKLKSKIENYRTILSREKKQSELINKTLNLIDYFYWMRIKANYRDVDFLDFDNNINATDAYNYLCCYINATKHYTCALKSIIETLKNQRGINH